MEKWTEIIGKYISIQFGNQDPFNSGTDTLVSL